MLWGRELTFPKGGEEEEHATSTLLLVPSSSGVSPPASQFVQKKFSQFAKTN